MTRQIRHRGARIAVDGRDEGVVGAVESIEDVADEFIIVDDLPDRSEFGAERAARSRAAAGVEARAPHLVAKVGS